jgi:hypothetical protein
MQIPRTFTKIILLISLSVWLAACGGGGGGDDDETEAIANCVLGSSTIGECKI